MLFMEETCIQYDTPNQATRMNPDSGLFIAELDVSRTSQRHQGLRCDCRMEEWLIIREDKRPRSSRIESATLEHAIFVDSLQL